MSIFDKMMEKDPAILAEKEQRSVEVKRLSKAFGEPFIVTYTVLSDKQIDAITEMAETQQDWKVHMVLEACKVEGRKFTDKAFLDWTGCLKGEDVVRKLFRAGEVNKLYNKISELSGYGENVIEDLKN